MLVIPPMRLAPALSILVACPPRTSRSPRSTFAPWRAGPRCPLPQPRPWSSPSWSSAGRCRRSATRSSRAVDADPRWVAGAGAFELLSFGGYIVLLWLVGARASGRLGLRESTQITLGGAAATRLLPTAGVGGAAVTLWALRRSGPRRPRRGAHAADLPRAALLGVPRLDRGDRHAAHDPRRPPAGADRAAGGARDGRHAAGAHRRLAAARGRRRPHRAPPPACSAARSATRSATCARSTRGCSARSSGGASTWPCCTGC